MLRDSFALRIYIFIYLFFGQMMRHFEQIYTFIDCIFKLYYTYINSCSNNVRQQKQ